MLAPAERRLLLDVLAPPDEYTLDEAIGTTYTLDLLALLRVPLAATALPWGNAGGGPVENPFALLTALRRNSSRISLYCHAGATKVPVRHIPLLAFLEDAVHPVTPPNPRGVFHPKLWLLRFAPEFDEDPVRYRLIVLSRNLTFDRSWDVALTLDGTLTSRRSGLRTNRPLSDFVTALPGMADAAGTDLPARARERAALLGEEVQRVEWLAPEGFESTAFHPIGHDGRDAWPVEDLYRLMVISPFVGGRALGRLRRNVRDRFSLVGRFEELAKLTDAERAAADTIDVFDDPGSLLDVGEGADEAPADDDEIELHGLHAKAFVGERDKKAVVFIGSANATEAAFECNVEFLVELTGSRSRHGIKAVRETFEDSGLLKPFKGATPLEIDENAEALTRKLERAAHELATGALKASAEPAGDERWRVSLYATRSVELDALGVEGRPLSQPTLQSVRLDSVPYCSFPPVALASVTPFFALRITGSFAGGERYIDVTVRLPLENAPTGRAEAVTAELLSDRERLLRFILLLLADDGRADRMLDELEELLGGESSPRDPSPGRTQIGLPLLEPMLRALHRHPERLAEIDRLIADIRTVGAESADLLPPELDELWSAISTVRQAEYG